MTMRAIEWAPDSRYATVQSMLTDLGRIGRAMLR